MTLNIAVVGHISRQDRAEELAASLGAELFLDRLTLGATWNHLRALNWGAEKTGHLIVLEDDAEPVPGFLELAAAWIDHHPEDLTSFYLGSGYLPAKPETVTTAIEEATTAGLDYVTFPRLFNAVCYTLPTRTITDLRMRTRDPADTGLGRAWTASTRRGILYSLPSYVDHADITSVENPGRRNIPRKAYQVHAGL